MSDMSESNKAIFNRLHEAMNSADPELRSRRIDELVHPEVIIRTPLPVEASGAEALKEVFTRLYRAFPDLHVTTEYLIAEGDKIVCRNTVTGTNLGEYMGRPPTGRPVTYNEIFIFRITNGRITETWGVVDVLAQLRQLGMLPIPEK